jgi:hypothetical protein
LNRIFIVGGFSHVEDANREITSEAYALLVSERSSALPLNFAEAIDEPQKNVVP